MLRVTVNNAGDVFFTFFVYFNAYFACFSFPLGSAEADIGRGKKTERLFDGKSCQEYSHQKLCGCGIFCSC